MTRDDFPSSESRTRLLGNTLLSIINSCAFQTDINEFNIRQKNLNIDIYQLTCNRPSNETAFILASALIHLTRSALSEQMRLITPAGTPDWMQISKNMQALSGVSLCGTIKHVLPVTSAMASLFTNESNELSTQPSIAT